MIIHKYNLMLCEQQTLYLPLNAKILTIQFQEFQGLGGFLQSELCMWASFDEEIPTEERKFAIIGTGHKINTEKVDYEYITTAQDGKYVWHIYEIIEPGVATDV